MKHTIEQPDISPDPSGRGWVLNEDFRVLTGETSLRKKMGPEGKLRTVTVRKDFLVLAGFLTDLASVPRGAWYLTYPKAHPSTAAAAVGHDWLYRYHSGLTRKQADQIFHAMLLENGAKRWKARLMYWAVRGFGRRAWNRGEQ